MTFILDIHRLPSTAVSDEPQDTAKNFPYAAFALLLDSNALPIVAPS
ncbi:MAG: hypothetical protein AVDCRST_MAG43-965 [uncultured Thermomicrobiales bacterium]|uniref:Uncharacterized protein n=1 Tax=uncultured Thermomicrobiales bacterium TaxID=1645740 RepID=A0A6J4ULB0_9BACT|nr:MAG: hypothetical protein AVDCRST_MAG43-965 [uncultured Thermomicrobiales bacterium]